MKPAPWVRTNEVSISYGNQLAVRNVTLDFPPQSITALIGPSGCGKTSLLSSLNRLTDLIAGCRVAGSIQVDELNVLDRKTDVVALRKRVGMIFQRPHPFPFSIRRNLELPLREIGIPTAERRERTERALEEVALWSEVKDRLDQPAMALSGGQQQRLCLARALMLEPQVILLDEPCTALDPLSADVVEAHIAKLKQHYTVVIVTHNLAQARRLADRVAFFWADERGGYLVEHGEADQVFRSPREKLTAEYITGRVG